MPKREDLCKKEKCFLFHLESSFRSCDNQILNFQICQMSSRNQMPKRETQKNFFELLGKQAQPGNETWPVYVTLQDNFFYHEIL